VRKHRARRLLGLFAAHQLGNYAQAIRSSEQTGGGRISSRRARTGRWKYGVGLNAEQELTKDIGVSPLAERWQD